MRSVGGEAARILRATSVHGAGRETTRRVVRFAGSPLSFTAAPGDEPTPQVLVENVGAAAAFLLDWREWGSIPPVVLQPSEAMTTAGFLAILGERAPRLLSPTLARAMVRATVPGSGLVPKLAAVHRRLELLCFGQRQVEGWLRGAGFTGPADRASWYRTRESCRWG